MQKVAIVLPTYLASLSRWTAVVLGYLLTLQSEGFARDPSVTPKDSSNMHQLPSLIPIVMRLLLARGKISAQPYRVTETAGFAEVDKVLEREGQGDWLGQVDLNVAVWLLHVGVRAQRDGTRADVTVTSKLDTLLGALDGYCVPVMRSLQILWNSELGMLMVAAYSVSGMPKCSWSMSISLMSYSLSLSLSALSKTMFTTSGASSAFRVRISSFCAQRRTFCSEVRLIPRAMLRSQRKGEKDSDFSIMDTRATWELSMAWRAMPESLQSKLQSWTKSLMASTTCTKCQSEIRIYLRKERRDTSSSPASFASAFRLISALNGWSVHRLPNISTKKVRIVREPLNLFQPFSGSKALETSSSLRPNPLPKLKLAMDVHHDAFHGQVRGSESAGSLTESTHLGSALYQQCQHIFQIPVPCVGTVSRFAQPIEQRPQIPYWPEEVGFGVAFSLQQRFEPKSTRGNTEERGSQGANI
ncbi:Proliferating cell nuclear [Hortaea werneckii]|nr:Proliferating cell nuclear [Hortaea werneckii]